MRLVLAILFACAFFNYVLSAFIDDNFGDLEIARPFNISWDELTRSPVTLELWGTTDPGKTLQLFNITTIAVILSGNSFQWKPASSLERNITYVMFLDGADTRDRSQPFKLVKNSETSSSTSSASTGSTNTVPSSTRSPSPVEITASTQTVAPDSPSRTQDASASTTSSFTSTPQGTSSPQTSANIRIAVSMTIVTILILITVAIIFFEHGKRVASRNQDTESSSSSKYNTSDGGIGSDGLQLYEGFSVLKSDVKSVTCASCKNFQSRDEQTCVNEGVGLGIQTQEGRRKKMKSLQSIYELG